MAILEVKNLHKSFGKTEVLKGIDFSMKQGEVVAVIGSSGGGKTTFLRCINFLETADIGQIYVEGKMIFDAQSIKSMSSYEIRENQLNFGLVFQQFNLFPQYNVLQNIVLAPLLLAKEHSNYKKNRDKIISEINENAKSILDRVGLSDKLDNYPCELSGGQQQRVSIARALILNPKVLFFDEPTSALDPELTGEILHVIKDLAVKNITMVIVTHEINFAKNVADRIVFIDEGVIVEDGTPEYVLDESKNPRIRAFLSKLED